MIQNYIKELESLEEEIKRKNNEIKELKKQQNIVKELIISFLKEQEEKGVKYNDKVFILNKNLVRIRKKKDQKLESIKEVLQKNNIEITSNIINDIIESQKGYKEEKEKLEIKKI
jgi:hypothetical protein